MTPEEIIRSVVDACADCDTCRYLMDSNCLLFPEIYNLYDRETERGEKITREELRNLTDLCNFCALCPCPNIRADIIKAKTAFIERDGLKFSLRALEDVGQIGNVCGVIPRLSNALIQNKLLSRVIKQILNIHQDRNIPEFPQENFLSWIKKHHPNLRDTAAPGFKKRKVAYFAGCTAKYLFPDVAKAVIEIFQHNQLEVFYPEQQCCGMPSLLEGDKHLTLKLAGFNINHLSELVEEGYDIVCSCPTCGYMLKEVLKEGAYYSDEYQKSVGADTTHIKIPVDSGKKEFTYLQKIIYGKILKDDGYFSSLNPLKRIQVAEYTSDLGEYLERLHHSGELETKFGEVSGNMVYYPPCHLREQKIGAPYLELLNLIPGLSVAKIQGSFYCCGMAGIMGFKKEFHTPSVHMGSSLIQKIREMNPERLITDCLSCRLQFNQLTSYKVFHPIEILRESYANY